MSEQAKILVVDDEKPLANALNLKLSHSGFSAKAAFNGREALEALETDKYDLMLMDLIMPIMDGFEVLAEMKKKEINVPVIVLSNLSQEEDAQKAKELGAVDFFIKSDMPIVEVVECINKILNKKG